MTAGQHPPQLTRPALTTPPDTVFVSFSAEIVPATTEQLLKVCCEMVSRSVKTIYLLISTPGGQVDCGINIFNVLRSLPCKIVTHNVGSVNSIGIVVFLAGEERYANPATSFMFHGVGFDAQNIRFEERSLVERLEGIRADQKRIGDIIRSRASFVEDGEIAKLFLQAAAKDTTFAKERGIIHDVKEAKVPLGAPVLQLVFKR